ncbi:non-heme iron oxygenase ferredoxin subunit [Rhodococcus zopfii]|uniref:Ferredoxin n=1 Tax=Rhodococcus sp. PY11 TaxID=551544 RepID=B5MAD3_9NOCA|nr:non-heme iron oxygenase ferredoxin subunit [Rhodococcus zopfii]CAR47861.1 ferredoxin [Rhodococcus sp. PY11]
MSTYVCNVSDVPPGQMKSVEVDSLPDPVLVCNVDGAYYAVDAICSHARVDLSEGSISGCEVECPLHSGRFDVTTGSATRKPAKKPLTTYPCSVVDGELYIDVTAAAPALVNTQP